MRVFSKSGATYQGDAYIFGEFNPTLGFRNADPREMIDSSPGAGLNVLTVGSYDWKDEFAMKVEVYLLRDVFGETIKIGNLSRYSSPGPLRIGDVWKPEIVAPGEWYAAATPSNVVPKRRDNSGDYRTHNGTTAATPYTAGVVALLFQKNPELTWGAVRKILTESATKNETTGECPNPHWGYGKLDYDAVKRALTNVSSSPASNVK